MKCTVQTRQLLFYPSALLIGMNLYAQEQGRRVIRAWGLKPTPPPIKLSRAKNNDTLCTVQCTQYCTCTRTCTVHSVQYYSTCA